jgi:sulfonate transport system substrate-binding protein
MIKLCVGGVPEHFNLPWHLGVESGRFRDSRANVSFHDYLGGTGELVAALEAGTLDVATLLFEGALAKILAGCGFRIVKVFVDTPLIWGIHVSADGPLTDIGQVTEPHYAISRPGSGSHLIAIVDAAERGWKTGPDSFTVVNSLDGARRHLAENPRDLFLWEKYMTRPLCESGEFRRIGETVVPWPAIVVAVRNGLLGHCRSTIRRVLEVNNQVCREISSDPAAAQVVATRYGLDWDDAKAWLEQTQWNTDFEIPEQAAMRIINCLAAMGMAPRAKVRLNDWWAPL